MTAPLNAWPVPDGFVIVPRKPTPAMCDALVSGNISWTGEELWRDVLAAAPAPPVPQAKDVPPAWDYASGGPIT
jgi:hypothetical protein